MREQKTLDKYLEHARQSQMIAINKTRKEMLELPVCPRCERIGLRDKGWKAYKIMACPYCNYEGPTSVILKGYLKDKLYR
ncbi:MAG: hypothetical protein M0Q14_10650 [Tissierellaceae bacterium]|nr:hypothetical protein [Tissierellaceae bacterium]